MDEDKTMKRMRGFTLVEMLVVILLVGLLAIMLVGLNSHDCTAGRARRSACGNNLGNLIKCCHLYADVVANLGMFPMYGSDPSANGLKSLNLIFNAYVKDHRVFSCPDAPTPTSTVPAFSGDQATMASWMMPQHTKYGYDPGHGPAHATVGVIADFSDDPTKNSSNHGSDRPGQNVAIGAGSVEYSFDKTGPHGIYTDEGAPEELETFIVQ